MKRSILIMAVIFWFHIPETLFALVWTTEIVQSGNVGYYNSIAVDGSGNPFIAYQDIGTNQIKLAVYSSSWNLLTVDNNAGA